MAHQGTIRARSRSMQSREDDHSGAGRIQQARSEDGAPDAVRGFVMRQLEALPVGGVLEIELGVEPGTLLDELAERGAPACVEKLARRRWMLLLRRPGEPDLLDLCDLEAPLPMERILETAAALRPGGELIARTPCFPRPLLAQLDRRGFDWEAAEAADGSGLVWVGRPL